MMVDGAGGRMVGSFWRTPRPSVDDIRMGTCALGTGLEPVIGTCTNDPRQSTALRCEFPLLLS